MGHFWWVTWAICSHRSLKRGNERIVSFILTYKKGLKNTILVKFFEQINWFYEQQSKWATWATWATWANCSQSLICHEQSKRFAHGRSFDMIDLSDLLTVAHLSWAICANRSQSLPWFERSEPMSDEQMSKFPTSPPGHGHQDVAARTWPPGHGHQDMATRMSTPRCGHQNMDPRTWMPGHGRQNVAAWTIWPLGQRSPGHVLTQYWKNSSFAEM